jgi:hypothetical protein
MLNSHNKKLAEQGRKRRAMYYRLWNKGDKSNKGLSSSDLARRYRVSRARMSILLTQAVEDLK